MRHVDEGNGRVVRVECDAWGSCDIVAARECSFAMAEIASMSPGMTDAEREAAGAARFEIVLRVYGERGSALHDRKRLLWFMRRVMGDLGLFAMDVTSTHMWPKSALDDELSHDAPLDVEQLYGIHAVYSESDDNGSRAKRTPEPYWVHTHGLAELGGFDFDLIQPGWGVTGDPMRAIAWRILEESVEVDGPPVVIADPGGVVQFVSTDYFHEAAPMRWQRMRENDADHNHDRAIACDPSRAGGRPPKRPRPSRFFQRRDLDQCVFAFSEEASTLMAERARRTLPLLNRLREEFASFEFLTLVKLGLPTSEGGREHIWFQVHSLNTERVDATCANEPFDVPDLSRGDRREYDLGLLSDWTILTPVGTITPRSLNVAREIRENPDLAR